jgi:AcrR family transcriptional regulator
MTSITRTGPIEGVRERRRTDSRMATVDAAFALFARHGYDAVTVADICDAAGIGRRTFFRYFASKDDVLSEPSRDMAAVVTAAIASAPQDAADAAVLRSALAEIADYVLEHRERLKLLPSLSSGEEGIRRAPYIRLTDSERAVARQLAARSGAADEPLSWQVRLLVGRAVAGFRVWMDDVVVQGHPDPHAHLAEIFDSDPFFSN